MFRTKCLICYSKNINNIIDLGMHPFADTFIPISKTHLSEKVYPLIVQLCEKCGNVQLGCKTDAESRYQENDYSYTSSNSNYSINYWFEYANEILKFFPKNIKLKILEIGSNDGLLLSILKNNHNVLGVDASPVMNKLAEKKNIETRLGIFDESYSKKISKEFGRFDLIIANNVFNHANEPQSFFMGIKNLLKKDGIFVFESPYWSNSVKSGKFDQIYHEHVTYMNVKSVKKLSSLNELYISDIVFSNYHGGSVRFVVSKNKKKENLDKVNKIVFRENQSNLYSPIFYEKFMKKIKQKKNKFMEKIFSSKNSSKPLICIGAAAKANTFLNFYGLNNNFVN
jgi:SAM-dependent methyltransferase